MLLNDAQKAILTQIRQVRTLEREAINRLERELREARAGYAGSHNLVREAHRMGVPKRQIGQAYGTSDAGTIKRIIEADVATPDGLLTVYTREVARKAPKAPPTAAKDPSDEVCVLNLTAGERETVENLFPGVENHNLAKILVDSLKIDADTKISGVAAVVDLTDMIALEATPNAVTRIFEAGTATWPEALTKALENLDLAPDLDTDNTAV